MTVRRWRSWRVCPRCGGRATKIFNLNWGLLECQQCSHFYTGDDPMYPLCIYHDPCADGMTAAWAVRRALDGKVELLPANYGDAPPDVRGRDVIMVDFSYKRDVIDEMTDVAKSILILDHHKSAQDELEGLPPPGAGAAWLAYYAGQSPTWMAPDVPKAYALFDMHRSGGRIAWEFFHKPRPTPELVLYTEDRDLWRFELPKSREISAWLRSLDLTPEVWSMACDRLSRRGSLEAAAEQGSAILRIEEKMIEGLLREGRRSMVIGGQKVPVCNCPPMLASELCGRLADSTPFAAVYYDAADKRRFSLRSNRRNGGADVSEIARCYGGGGHMAAAGFEAPIGWEGDT